MNIFPEFESRQVLTSEELNWLGCYLDQQNRQTRRLLVGCGLVGGLQLRMKEDKLMVSNGCGITSAGHIAILSNSDSYTAFGKIRKYEIDRKDKLAFHYLSSQNMLEENYINSVDNTSLYFPEFSDEIYELLEDTRNEGDPLKLDNVKGMVAVLFVEILQKELKDCEGDNCQERGKKYVFENKVLLFNREDALTLIRYQYEMSKASEQQLSQTAFPWLHLPNLNILKPVIAKSNLVDGFTNQIIIKNYKSCIIDLLEYLKNQGVLMDQVLSSLKQHVSLGIRDSTKVIQTFIEQLTSFMDTASKHIYSMQNLYDFCLKFVQGYQELQTEAQSLRAALMIREDAFPNHILLGIIGDDANEFENLVSTKDMLFRHRFYPSPAQASQSAQCKKVEFYLERMKALASAYNRATFQDEKELKITPSGSQFGPLSLQAIPFYLSKSVLSHWTIYAKQQFLNDYVSSYHFTNQDTNVSVNSGYATQGCSMYANQAFYRIEGLNNKNASTAMSKVFEVRKNKGLAFEVLMLRLNEKAPFNHSFNLSINEDLLSLYQVVRSELLKQIQFNTDYFGSLKIQQEVFNGLKDEVSKALEASYFKFMDILNKDLLVKLNLDLDNAVIASNITQNNRFNEVTSEVKFNELNTKMKTFNSSKFTTLTQNKILSEKVKGKFLYDGFIHANIDFPIFVLFQNTLGALISSIRNDSKFKKSTDISFYTHLSNVAESMLSTSKEKSLFYAVLKLYCALQLQLEYLVDDFLELDLKEFESNLNNKLIVSCLNVTDKLKNKNSLDSIFEEIEQEPILHFTERIQFDDDWIKVRQISLENQKRNGGLGVENLLERFVNLHPGISHGHGVPLGGTFIMVYDETNEVVADFYLPYLISSHLRPIQFTLLENKSLTLSGKVTSAAGQIVSASIEIGNSSVFTDKEGFYNALVANSTKIIVKCKVSGYENFEKEIDIKNQSEILNIILKPSVLKQKKTVLFYNEQNEQLNVNLELLDVGSNKNVVAKEGRLVLEDMVNTKYEFKIIDDRFVHENFIVQIDPEESEVKIVCVDLVFMLIKIVDQNSGKFRNDLLKSLKIQNETVSFNLKDEASGLFVSDKKLPTNKTFIVALQYNGEEFNKHCSPSTITEFVIPKAVENSLKELRTFVLIHYPQNQTRLIPKLEVIQINRTKIEINKDTNIGTDIILTDGSISLGKPLIKTPGFTISDAETVSSFIVIIDASLVMDNINIAENDLMIHFVRAYSVDRLKIIAKKFPAIKALIERTDLKSENVYCIISSKNDQDSIKEMFS